MPPNVIHHVQTLYSATFTRTHTPCFGKMWSGGLRGGKPWSRSTTGRLVRLIQPRQSVSRGLHVFRAGRTGARPPCRCSCAAAPSSIWTASSSSASCSTCARAISPPSVLSAGRCVCDHHKRSGWARHCTVGASAQRIGRPPCQHPCLSAYPSSVVRHAVGSSRLETLCGGVGHLTSEPFT